MYRKRYNATRGAAIVMDMDTLNALQSMDQLHPQNLTTIGNVFNTNFIHGVSHGFPQSKLSGNVAFPKLKTLRSL
jgi:hypothetical protein